MQIPSVTFMYPVLRGTPLDHHFTLWKWLRLFSLIIFTALTAFGSPVVETTDYLIDAWTSDDDLPDSSVTAVTQTPDGYLWIGTYNGLARFDGVRFVTFDPVNTPELKHARITGLFVDDCRARFGSILMMVR